MAAKQGPHWECRKEQARLRTLFESAESRLIEQAERFTGAIGILARMCADAKEETRQLKYALAQMTAQFEGANAAFNAAMTKLAPEIESEDGRAVSGNRKEE